MGDTQQDQSQGKVIIVCGGRDFTDYEYLKEILDYVRTKGNVVELHHGDARGADRLAGRYARENGITEQRHPADWNRYGRSAGHRRNESMLKAAQPHLVIAFPGGVGTANMVNITKKAGVRVLDARQRPSVPKGR